MNITPEPTVGSGAFSSGRRRCFIAVVLVALTLVLMLVAPGMKTSAPRELVVVRRGMMASSRAGKPASGGASSPVELRDRIFCVWSNARSRHNPNGTNPSGFLVLRDALVLSPPENEFHRLPPFRVVMPRRTNATTKKDASDGPFFEAKRDVANRMGSCGSKWWPKAHQLEAADPDPLTATTWSDCLLPRQQKEATAAGRTGSSAKRVITVRMPVFLWNAMHMYHGLMGPLGALNILHTQRLAKREIYKQLRYSQEDTAEASGDRPRLRFHVEVAATFDEQEGNATRFTRGVYRELFGEPWGNNEQGEAVDLAEASVPRARCVAGDWVVAGMVPFEYYRHLKPPKEPTFSLDDDQRASLLELRQRSNEGATRRCGNKEDASGNHTTPAVTIIDRPVVLDGARWRGIRPQVESRLLPAIMSALGLQQNSSSAAPVRRVDPKTLSFCEQVRLFRSSPVVLLGEGAAMMGALFAPRNATYIMVWDHDENPAKLPFAFHRMHYDWAAVLGRHRVITFEVCGNRTAPIVSLVAALEAPFELGSTFLSCVDVLASAAVGLANETIPEQLL